jgi:hypothetical protein
MDAAELEAILDWMRAMRQGWEATNAAVIEALRAQRDHQAAATFSGKVAAAAGQMDALEAALRRRIAALRS